jgi:hypothetical protein
MNYRSALNSHAASRSAFRAGKARKDAGTEKLGWESRFQILRSQDYDIGVAVSVAVALVAIGLMR